MVDLSFTKDSEWIKVREIMWKPIGESLKEDFRKKEVEKIRQYFFTGELPKDYKLSDGARFSYFPLATPEGWDHVLEQLVVDPKVFEDKVYDCLRYQGDKFTPEQELALWDYFLGETYQPVVRSRVPVGKPKKLVEIELYHARLLGLILGPISTWLDGPEYYGTNPKWIVKKEYFFSMLPMIKPDYFTVQDKRSKETKAGTMITRLMQTALSYRDEADAEPNRKAFLEEFIDKLETMENLPDCLKQRWSEVKAEHGGI